MTAKKSSLKIAFLLQNFPSMSERFVLRQITGLLDLGHQVDIVAEQNPGQPVIHDEVQRYDLLKRTYYLPSVPSNKWLCRLKTAGLIGLNLLRHPIDLFRVLQVNLQRRRGFNYVCFYYGLCCQGRRYDIAHGHFGPAGEAAVLLKKAGLAKAAVTTFHGHDVTSYVRRYGRQVYRQLLEEGDLFTYNSEITKQRVLDLGGPPEKMVKLPMGVELDKIPFIERQMPKDRPVRILSVGRLVQMKGRKYAIQAVAQAMDQYPNLEYLIAGDGPLRQTLQRQIEICGHADKIKILGWVSDEELGRLYRSSQIFLHPSVTADDGNQEGQGVVLVEAQASGLIVIATSHGAFPETVLDGQTGYLVPEKDTEALQDCLAKVLSSSDGWPQIGRNARRHAEMNYDIDLLNSQLEGLYYRLIETKENQH